MSRHTTYRPRPSFDQIVMAGSTPAVANGFPEIQYQASARLVNYLCEKYHIPKERSHMLGHQKADRGTDHNCPGRSWNWPSYMALLNRQSTSTPIANPVANDLSEHEQTHEPAISHSH